jgi:hypothetical protein
MWASTGQSLDPAFCSYSLSILKYRMSSKTRIFVHKPDMKRKDKFWIWANEPTSDRQAMIYGVPSLVEQLDLEFDKGTTVQTPIPIISLIQNKNSRGTLTDNLIAPGLRGLVFSSRLRLLLEANAVHNLQYFPFHLRASNTTTLYHIANIIGLEVCLDRGKVQAEWDTENPNRVLFFDNLIVREDFSTDKMIFRLGEFPQVVLVADLIRRVCEDAGITGVRFYQPAEYSL